MILGCHEDSWEPHFVKYFAKACQLYLVSFLPFLLLLSGGKSAILAALIVGLGGKATFTNRGGSLKEFVKTGEK